MSRAIGWTTWIRSVRRGFLGVRFLGVWLLFAGIEGAVATVSRPAPVSGLQPDHRVFSFSDSKDLLTDVTIVFPRGNNAIEFRETQKLQKYTRSASGDWILGPQYSFAPLVADIYGAWGAKAQFVMDQCAKLYAEAGAGTQCKAHFKDVHWKLLSVRLQQANYNFARSYLDAIQASATRALTDCTDFIRTAFGQVPSSPTLV